jgi:hypothetical protein
MILPNSPPPRFLPRIVSRAEKREEGVPLSIRPRISSARPPPEGRAGPPGADPKAGSSVWTEFSFTSGDEPQEKRKRTQNTPTHKFPTDQSLFHLPGVEFRAKGDQNQNKPGQNDQERPPVQHELPKRKRYQVQGKYQESGSQGYENYRGNYIGGMYAAETAPARGKEGEAGKNGKQRPCLGKGNRQDLEGKEKEKKTYQKKKCGQEKVDRPLVQAYCQKGEKGTKDHEEKRDQHGNMGRAGKTSQEKGASKKHKEQSDNENQTSHCLAIKGMHNY